jgi:hypothetical protein
MERASSKLWLLGLLLLGVSCAITEPREAERIATLYVAPNRATCFAPWPMECLVAREESEPEWGFHYFGIDGFTHEPGYRYVLRVGIRPIPNPPADGSSLAYRLIQVVAKEPCAAIFTPGGANPEPPGWVGC